MAQTETMLECLGGPLCGSKVPDYKELWLTIQSVENEDEQHFYKRIKMTSLFQRFFGEFRGTVWRIRDRRWLRLVGWKHLPPTTPDCWEPTTPGGLSRLTCGSRIAESTSA